MATSQTQTTTHKTPHGDIDVEIVDCLVCESSVTMDDATEWHGGKQAEEKSTKTVRLEPGTHKEGYLCQSCTKKFADERGEVNYKKQRDTTEYGSVDYEVGECSYCEKTVPRDDLTEWFSGSGATERFVSELEYHRVSFDSTPDALCLCDDCSNYQSKGSGASVIFGALLYMLIIGFAVFWLFVLPVMHPI